MSTVKKRSQKQEKSVAKDFNAKPTVASGALWGMKGDVRNSKFLIECKTTSKDYFNITTKLWEKIKTEATRDRMRIPLMVIDLEDSDRLVVFNPHDFETELPTPYDCTYDENRDGKQSYRISIKELDNIAKEFDEPYIYGKLFIIKGTVKNNMLFFMRMKDFTKHFAEELALF